MLTHRYNAGRDEVVGNVTGTMIPLQSVTNQSTFSGQSSFGNYTYQTDVTYVSGLLNDTSGTSPFIQLVTRADDQRESTIMSRKFTPISHSLNVRLTCSVAPEGKNAIDGLVAVLTVKIVSRPQVEAAK